jgi:hypothetical protein
LPIDKEKFFIAKSIISSDGERCEPEVINSVDPKEGRIGIRRSWRCPAAPIQMKVLVFGNSFFERGGDSTSLSWWFARIFSEFHFIWSPEMSPEEIEFLKPDLVVGQTIERFMRVVPSL